MSYIHPLILNSGESLEDNKVRSSLRRLPFPLIGLNWEGFTASHLRWIGFKVPKLDQRLDELKQIRYLRERIGLAVAHEWVHKYLSDTPFILVKNNEMYKLYHMIYNLSKGTEQIDVPLTADLEGNMLQKQWAVVDSLKRSSILVEEVYAVRESLLLAQVKGYIQDAKKLDRILTYSKQAYGKMIGDISVFEAVYNAFDLMARNIGRAATVTMIHNVLATGYPDAAFMCILTTLVDTQASIGFQWRLPPDITSQLAANGDYDEWDKPPQDAFVRAYSFFSDITDTVDPNDLIYRRKAVSENKKLVRQWFRDYLQDGAEKGIYHFLYDDSNNDFIMSEYNNTNGLLSLNKVVVSQEALRNKETQGALRYEEIGEAEFYDLILEAIVHQLVAGVGLRCPFWNSTHGCCGSGNKSFLQQVWERTKPDCSKCELWERLGCLA